MKRLSLGILGLALLLGACTRNESAMSSDRAYGKPDNIYLITDNDIWMDTVGMVFLDHFERYYPVMPQPEPMFDIRFVESSKMNSTFRKFRTLVYLVDLSRSGNHVADAELILGKDIKSKVAAQPDKNVFYLKDTWVLDQMIVFILGNNRQHLLETIASQAPKISEKIYKKDEEKHKAMIYHANNENAEVVITKEFGVSMKIPKSYVHIANEEGKYLWLRKEDAYQNSNIFIRKYPLADSTRLNEANFKRLRNNFTHQYVIDKKADAYQMIYEDLPKPEFKQVTLGGYPALECRGVYHTKNKFMGGPFISYLIEDAANKQVILLDGNVYAPGGQNENSKQKKWEEWYKRPYIRQLEVIFKTLEKPKE